VEDKYLSLAQLARHIGLSRRTLQTHVTNPTDPIPSFKLGGKRLVCLREFNAWLERRREKHLDLDSVVAEVLRRRP
jgi:hypothetical protein